METDRRLEDAQSNLWVRSQRLCACVIREIVHLMKTTVGKEWTTMLKMTHFSVKSTPFGKHIFIPGVKISNGT